MKHKLSDWEFASKVLSVSMNIHETTNIFRDGPYMLKSFNFIEPDTNFMDFWILPKRGRLIVFHVLHYWKFFRLQ